VQYFTKSLNNRQHVFQEDGWNATVSDMRIESTKQEQPFSTQPNPSINQNTLSRKIALSQIANAESSQNATPKTNSEPHPESSPNENKQSSTSKSVKSHSSFRNQITYLFPHLVSTPRRRISSIFLTIASSFSSPSFRCSISYLISLPSKFCNQSVSSTASRAPLPVTISITADP